MECKDRCRPAAANTAATVCQVKGRFLHLNREVTPVNPSRQRYRLCKATQLDRSGAHGRSIETPRGPIEVVVLRYGGKILGYINRCPHQGTPLETFPDQFLDESGAFLICSTHGARFRASDGACLFGPCRGVGLQRVDLVCEAGMIYVEL